MSKLLKFIGTIGSGLALCGYFLSRIVIMMAAFLYLSSIGVVFGVVGTVTMMLYVTYPIIMRLKGSWWRNR